MYILYCIDINYNDIKLKNVHDIFCNIVLEFLFEYKKNFLDISIIEKIFNL